MGQDERDFWLREFETIIKRKMKTKSKTISSLKYFPSGLWPRATDTLKIAYFKEDRMLNFILFVYSEISPKSDNLNKNLATRIMYDTKVWFKYINKLFNISCACSLVYLVADQW